MGDTILWKRPEQPALEWWTGWGAAVHPRAGVQCSCEVAHARRFSHKGSWLFPLQPQDLGANTTPYGGLKRTAVLRVDVVVYRLQNKRRFLLQNSALNDPFPGLHSG
jgi:hypothetical protein